MVDLSSKLLAPRKIVEDLLPLCATFLVAREQVRPIRSDDFLYRFCTAAPAIQPFWPIETIGGSITYMFSTLLHSSIPTSSTIFSITCGTRRPCRHPTKGRYLLSDVAIEKIAKHH
jgi:hypothetical protein